MIPTIFDILGPIDDLMQPHRQGPGKRTVFTIHNRAAKSHAGKPDGYVKRGGIRSKGYAEHGNGKTLAAQE